MPNNEPEVVLNLEYKPMSERAQRAWSTFWDEIIEESKKEIAADTNSGRECVTDERSISNN